MNSPDTQEGTEEFLPRNKYVLRFRIDLWPFLILIALSS